MFLRETTAFCLLATALTQPTYYTPYMVSKTSVLTSVTRLEALQKPRILILWNLLNYAKLQPPMKYWMIKITKSAIEKTYSYTGDSPKKYILYATQILTCMNISIYDDSTGFFPNYFTVKWHCYFAYMYNFIVLL